MSTKNFGREFASLMYTTIQGLFGFSYFGYITIQPLIIAYLLRQSGNQSATRDTILIISCHLILQSLLETPSGAYADKLGRMRAVRDSFIARCLAMCMMIGLLIAQPSEENTIYLTLVAIQILLAAGEALYSGSLEAWLVDTLEVAGEKSTAGDVFAQAAIIKNFSICLAMSFFIIGATTFESAANPGQHWILFLSISLLGFMVAGSLAFGARKEKYRLGLQWNKRAKASVSSAWKGGLAEVLAGKAIRASMALIAAPIGAWVIISWFWPLLAKDAVEKGTIAEQEVILISLGIGLGLARIFGAWLAQKLQRALSVTTGLGAVVCINLSMGIVAPLAIFFISPQGTSNELFLLLFFISFVIAKATEESVKILRQTVLSILIEDSTVRATGISFGEMFGNGLAFLLIWLGAGASHTLNLTRSDSATLILFVCASVGLMLAAWAASKLVQSINSNLENETEYGKA